MPSGLDVTCPVTKAQAIALHNFNYYQRHIRRVLGCSKGALQNNVKHHIDKWDILKISLVDMVEGTPLVSQLLTGKHLYHTVV